jgi:hypothetical protein
MLRPRKTKRKKKGRRKRIDKMNDIFSEHFAFIFAGIVSVWYAYSWIRKILKSPKPYYIQQYIYIAFALIMIFCGISTFFFMCTLNCLCGVYAGLLEINNLYHEYTESKNNKDDINIYYYLNGLGLGLSLVIIGLYFTLKLYLD